MSQRNRSLALAGIMTAITVILLFFAAIIPNVKILLYGLSSLPIAVIIIECDKKTALLYFVATTTLAFLLIPNKTAVLPYATILGLYGLVKAIAEKMPNITGEWIVKFLYFNGALALYLFLLIQLFLPNIQFPIPLWIMIIGAEILFIIYDYVYSFCIGFYEGALRKKVNSYQRFTKR